MTANKRDIKCLFKMRSKSVKDIHHSHRTRMTEYKINILNLIIFVGFIGLFIYPTNHTKHIKSYQKDAPTQRKIMHRHKNHFSSPRGRSLVITENSSLSSLRT